MTTIPRYKASFPLQSQFITNADFSGDHVFTQIKRKGMVCIYKRSTFDGKVVGYEVILVKLVKAGSPLPGGGVMESDYESYPGGKAFGRTGWFFPNLSSAEAKFTSLVEKESQKSQLPIITAATPPSVPSKKSGNYTVPAGEFTSSEFATMNNINGSAYPVIKILLSENVIRENRREKRTSGPGRPTVLYTLN